MKNNQCTGFTLIELMLVVVIIVILAALGTTFWAKYITQTNRTDAKTTLLETASSLEKCKLLYGAYNSANCTVADPITSPAEYYNITKEAITTYSFTLAATPVAGKRQASDAECTSLTLTHTGVKSGTGTAPDECW